MKNTIYDDLIIAGICKGDDGVWSFADVLAKAGNDNDFDINHKHLKGMTVAHFLAVSADAETEIKLLLDNNAEVDARDDNEHTPLHMAALNGNDKIVQLLLNRKADANAENFIGKTPLFAACHHNKLSIARVLIASGAKVNLDEPEIKDMVEKIKNVDKKNAALHSK